MDSKETITSTASKIDRWTHVIFPARSFIKDCIYWPAEIVAGVFFFVWILQMDLVEYTNPADSSKSVRVYKPTSPRLEIREYGWIALCYTIKQFVYIIDTILLTRSIPAHVTVIDVITPAANFLMWGLWMLFGFLNAGLEIYAGYTYRIKVDGLDYAKSKYNYPDATYNAYKEAAKNDYDNTAKWVWLWVPTGIFALINLAFWILGMMRRRSSLFTNATLSTFGIALSLFFLALFQKAWWISSNTKYYAENPPKDWDDAISADEYEARYVFPIIYFGSWFGLLFAVVCVYRAHLAKAFDIRDTVKFSLYSVFWVSGFFWCLFVDATVFQSLYIQYRLGLIITTIVCLIMALIIGAISILQKRVYGPALYDRHANYANW